MAKDPAFLFYSQDFYTGVATLSFEDRGKFISILCLMHQQGRMNEETIRFLVGSVSDNLKSKFRIDENGLWYNERLEIESEKRAKFTESRRNNGLSGGRPAKSKPNAKPKKNHMDNHMEDENVNVNEDVNTNTIREIKKEKDLEERQHEFAETIKPYLNQYGKEMCLAFYNYWSETDKRGKMRYELQRTWEVSKRLVTWNNNNKSFNNGKQIKQDKQSERDAMEKRLREKLGL